MKKLLLMGVILALGATAFADNPADGTKASANVEVRAEIVDDSLVISDIYGKPILLDFGKIQKKSTAQASAEVDYKVTSGTAAKTKAIGLDIELNGAKGLSALTLENVNGLGTDNDKLNVKIGLDKETGEIPVDKNEYRGKIMGTFSGDTSDNTLGMYKNYTEITVTVTGQSE